ncbi:haloacid dehalogenase [Spirochaetia bacterium]|nr:haloacid dehalogenase [Spirochaetia bacterium]
MVTDTFLGAIFDLDGTLADSMNLWDHLCRDWLLTQGKEAPADLEETLAPLTVTQAAEYVSKNFTPGIGPAEIAALWEALVIGRYRETVPLKDGAVELLDALARRGVKLALATSCFPAAAEAFLQGRKIRHYFSSLFFTDEVSSGVSMDAGGNTPVKADPVFWRVCAEKMGLPADKIIVFEDIYEALAGVRSAGMGFVAVYDASCKKWDALQKEADRAIRSFREFQVW